MNISLGLMYALCVSAKAANIRCSICTPRLPLLRRWQAAGVPLKQARSAAVLLCSLSAAVARGDSSLHHVAWCSAYCEGQVLCSVLSCMVRAVWSELRLIHRPTSHDHEYYKASTVAQFRVEHVLDSLKSKLDLLGTPSA
jgi:hypothetical protein